MLKSRQNSQKNSIKVRTFGVFVVNGFPTAVKTYSYSKSIVSISTRLSFLFLVQFGINVIPAPSFASKYNTAVVHNRKY